MEITIRCTCGEILEEWGFVAEGDVKFDPCEKCMETVRAEGVEEGKAKEDSDEPQS